jgi:hypothetical protein
VFSSPSLPFPSWSSAGSGRFVACAGCFTPVGPAMLDTCMDLITAMHRLLLGIYGGSLHLVLFVVDVQRYAECGRFWHN